MHENGTIYWSIVILLVFIFTKNGSDFPETIIAINAQYGVSAGDFSSIYAKILTAMIYCYHELNISLVTSSGRQPFIALLLFTDFYICFATIL